MAEIAQDGGGGHKKGGKVRSKKMSTRIDFTPMVDLGFLLITFFMLTTTLAKPQIMALVMPDKDLDIEDIEPVKESKVLTLLLGGNDKVYWYEGITDAKLDSTDYSAEGVRDIIYKKQKSVGKEHGDPEKMIVIIKMTDGATYKNMVDILDEMDITSTKIYAIQDIAELEKEAIANGGRLDVVPE